MATVPRIFTQVELDYIVRSYNSGMGIKQLARELRTNDKRIADELHAANVTMRGTNRRERPLGQHIPGWDVVIRPGWR